MLWFTVTKLSAAAPCDSGAEYINTTLSHLIQLLLRLFLHASYVIHGKLNPFVNGAEQLSVELGEQTLLHLDRENRCVIETEQGLEIRQWPVGEE